MHTDFIFSELGLGPIPIRGQELFRAQLALNEASLVCYPCHQLDLPYIGSPKA